MIGLVLPSLSCYFAELVISAAPFVPTSDDLRPFAAEMWLVGGIAANLILPFAIRRPNVACALATLFSLLIAASTLAVLGSNSPLFGEHLRGLLIFDSIALTWKLLLLLFVAGVVMLWLGHSGRTLRQGDAPEFFVLLLGATLGMCLMASTTNLLMIVLSIAMASLPSYLLSGYRKQSKSSAEASLKYVLFGAVTGAIMIYAVSFLYGIFGTLQLSAIGNHPVPATAIAAVSLAMVGLLIGIGFKISAVPLHLWCPDVFEGSTIEVTTFLSVASKGAALLLLLRIVHLLNLPYLATAIGVIGAITATVGNTAAFTQTSIKRLLAYSSIAQAGYMMCLIAGDQTQNSTVERALLLYLIIYAVMNLGAFAVSAIVIRQHEDSIENFAGLGRSSPLVAGSFFCCLISLIGLPPFAGFGAKVNILWLLAGSGGFGIALVAVIVLNTVLSAFYYFRIIHAMYLQPATDRSRSRQLFSRDPLGVSLAAGCAAVLVLLFFGFGALYTLLTPKPSPAPLPMISKNSVTPAPAISVVRAEHL